MTETPAFDCLALQPLLASVVQARPSQSPSVPVRVMFIRHVGTDMARRLVRVCVFVPMSNQAGFRAIGASGPDLKEQK